MKKLSKAEQEAKAKLDWCGDLAERHWKEHRPSLVRQLQKKGQLYQSLVEAQEKAADLFCRLLQDLKRQGVPGGQACFLAKSLALREYILLPSEEDVPLLGERPER